MKCRPCMRSQEQGKCHIPGNAAKQRGPSQTTELTPGHERLSTSQDWDPCKLQNDSTKEKQEVIAEETGECVS